MKGENDVLTTVVAKVVKTSRLHRSSWAPIKPRSEREANSLFSKTVLGYSGYKDSKT